MLCTIADYPSAKNENAAGAAGNRRGKTEPAIGWGLVRLDWAEGKFQLPPTKSTRALNGAEIDDVYILRLPP